MSTTTRSCPRTDCQSDEIWDWCQECRHAAWCVRYDAGMGAGAFARLVDRSTEELNDIFGSPERHSRPSLIGVMIGNLLDERQNAGDPWFWLGGDVA